MNSNTSQSSHGQSRTGSGESMFTNAILRGIQADVCKDGSNGVYRLSDSCPQFKLRKAILEENGFVPSDDFGGWEPGFVGSMVDEYHFNGVIELPKEHPEYQFRKHYLELSGFVFDDEKRGWIYMDDHMASPPAPGHPAPETSEFDHEEYYERMVESGFYDDTEFWDGGY